MDSQIPLFEASGKITLETYLALNRALFAMKLRKFRLGYFILMGASLLLLLVLKSYVIFGLLLLFAISYPFLLMWLAGWRGKKYFLQTKSIQDKEIQYSFFQYHFKTCQSSGNGSYLYSEVFRMTITDSALYLFINDIQAFIIERGSVSPELLTFLKNQSSSFSAKKNKVIE